MTMIRQLFLTIAVLLCVIPSLPARNEGRFSRGGGMMVFTAYEPMKAHPVNLYYYIPTQGNIKKMRVLFSMHGAERNGRLQRGVWRNLAEEYGFIVLAPEFKHDTGKFQAETPRSLDISTDRSHIRLFQGFDRQHKRNIRHVRTFGGRAVRAPVPSRHAGSKGGKGRGRQPGKLHLP